MIKISMFSLGSGKRAHLTTQLQNKVFTPQQAADYAKKQWNLEVDVQSIEAYMRDESDPLSPQSGYTQADELPEIAISSALSKDLTAVGEGLTVVKHQYALQSGKIIDILCKDKSNKWIVVEVKKSVISDVLNQLLTYMAELKEEHPEEEVKGVIMTNIYDSTLDKKVRLLKNSGIELRYYKLKVLPATEQEVMS